MAGCSLERTCNYIFWEIHRMWMFVSALVLVGADQSLIANTSQQVLSLLFNVAFVSGQCPSTKPARCQMKNCCSGSLWSQMVKLPNRISLNQAFPTHHEHWLPSSPPCCPQCGRSAVLPFSPSYQWTHFVLAASAASSPAALAPIS